jgi:hypothetical protein
MLEGCLKHLVGEGCGKTRLNEVYGLKAFHVVSDASPDDQKLIWGWTTSDIQAGKPCPMPKGWKTASVEIGRYIEASGSDSDEVLSILVDARKRGLAWSVISAHFRSMRLGERGGNAQALFNILRRALNDYWKRFPKTDAEVMKSAIEELLKSVNRQHSKT